MPRKLIHIEQTTRQQRRCAGFTLTEVVVASALLIVAIVPILKALTSGHVMTALIEQKTRSLTLAQAKMDEIRARSIYEYSTLYSQNSTTLGDSYLCTVVDTAMGSDLRNVEVTVGYDHDGDGILASDEIDVTLATLIARRW